MASSAYGRPWVGNCKGEEMRVGFEEYKTLYVIYLDDGNLCSCDLEKAIHNEDLEFADGSYYDIWQKVCEDVFGSFLFRAKYFTIESYVIFYPRSRNKFIAKMQKNHLAFVAKIANLEIERIDKLIADKYGEQLKMRLK
jgi:hypothetical protein